MEVGSPGSKDELVVEGLTGTMRLEGRWLWIDDEPVFLGPRERDVMGFFMRHPNCVYSSVQVTNCVWGAGYDPRNSRLAVARLRQKIEEDPGSPRLLRGVGGGGYIMITDKKREVAFDRIYQRSGRRRK